MRVLLVEDDALIALDLEMMLRDAGYAVVGPAASVAAALALVEARRPDIALVDINLGSGGCGIDLARKLRARWNVPSLFISGQVLDARENQDAALGVIAKPFQRSTVIDSIAAANEVLRGRMPRKIPRGFELFCDKPRMHTMLG